MQYGGTYCRTYGGTYMKDIFSGFVFLGTMLGFSSQWTLNKKPKQTPVSEVQEELIVNPSQIEVTETVDLVEQIEQYFPAVANAIQAEVSLYGEYQQLDTGDNIRIEYQDEVPTRLTIHRSKYEQLRIEMLPEPSIIVDTLPLDAKSIVYSFSASQLLSPNDDLLQIFDLEPGLLGVIDNEVDIVKQLPETANIEILAIGRYKDDSLERLDKVLSLRINQEEGSTMLFKYPSEKTDVWYTEDLKVRSFPFLNTPTDHILVSSGFGEIRGEKIHKGIDFAATTGTPIYAAASGIVSKAGWGTGYGLMAKISHEQLGDYETLYAHMSRRYVREGQYVRQGELIGLVGSTGKSTGPHLHYEMHANRHKVNPRSRGFAKKFEPKANDVVELEGYRDSIDKIFVQASIEVIDLTELLAQN